MRFQSLALAALIATNALPAYASYTTIDYTGHVSKIYAATGGPEAPADIYVGEPVYFSLSVDLSQLVSYGAGTYTVPNGQTGAPMVIHPAGISLALDPAATYTITLGSGTAANPITHVWTQADDTDEDQGYYYSTGEDPNAIEPLLGYDGVPSTVIGMSQNAVNAEGLYFYTASEDYLLQYIDHPVYGGSTADGGFGFAVDYDSPLNDAIDAVRAQALAEGQVPEPSSVLLLVIGAVCLFKASRRKAGAAPGMTFVAA